MADGAGRALVLVVDDDAAVAETLRLTLELEFDVLAVTRPEAAMATLAARDVSVILSDVWMPGMDGVELLTEARQLHPELIGVLITAYADVQAAMQAINEARAFAFVTKPWDADELLALVRRAVDAHRALSRQRGAAMQQHHREMAGLEQMSVGAMPTPLTAQSFGVIALRERAPAIYAELLQDYAAALEQSFEQRIYRVDHRISDTLIALADRLGHQRAGPRDVVDMHTTALKQRLATATSEEVEAYAEEGRLLILELMGHLVSYYRMYTLGVTT